MRNYIFLVGLFFYLSTGMAQAATFNFNGVDVSNCARSGAQYTCGNLSMADTDVIVIANGYGVTFNSSLTMTYNQGLRMSGSAALTATGNLDIKDINPSNLKVTGGSLTAEGGTFSMGAQAQTIIANIAATTIKMGGSAVKVTGSISAKGLVEIASGSTITGAIGGNIVNILPANSQIEGDITAKTTLTIGSGSQIKGNLAAPTIDLKASGLVVTGDVTALKSLTIASGNAINGNVEGGNVTLDAANGYITGNALVDHITLGSWTHVDQTITCKAYTPANPCSCVTNNSGWPAGSVNGPKCGPGTPTGPHHFQIDHRGTALTCAPQTVTVTACADAACSVKYTGGTDVTVSPGGTLTPIDSSGVATASVRQYTVGTATLSLTSVPGATGALVCKRASDNSSSCDMSFAATGLMVTPVNHHSAVATAFNISALQDKPNEQACVPLFRNASKDLTLSCGYSNPATGTLPVLVKGTGAFVPLAASASSACSATGQSVNLAFDNAGVATATMLYADAGKLTLNAKYESASGSDKGLKMQGSGEVVVAPYDFVFSAIATPQRAGLAVTGVAPATVVSVSARNALKAVTPNFGREAAAPAVLLGRTVVEPTFAGHAEPSADGSLGFSGGVLIATGMSWKEVGLVQFTASLNNYLGWQRPAVNGVVPPLASGTSGQVQFIPHHFITELIKKDDGDEPAATNGIATPCAAPLTCANDGEKGRYAYSGQAIGVRVTARALGGATTQNYDELNPGVLAPVLLEGLDAATGTISFPPSTPDGSSRLTDGSKAQTTVTGVAPAKFTLGIARSMVAYRFPGKAGVPVTVAPTDVLLRASSTYPGGAVVSSSSALIQNEARMTVLSGQWQVAHGYGSELLPVRLAVQVQYWNGTKWITNLLDSISAFSKSQVLFVNCKKTLDCSKLAADDLAYAVVQGALPQANRLTLLAPGAGKAGRVDVSVGNHPYLGSTVGVVVFGILRSGPVIYLREMY
ncbi:polymer-forming cytoskeletal protein [Janthinobacterium tructae]|uniref:Polymer-forming cytoskeletal protein n=1 Tax=Janthinobacterium tructae TaxID=2590869 RepID=A0A4Y6RJP8_9BURK|nr:polymer-forming cytoskeletal protein [Janthinobacterium tructae]QDG72657.1 polymer-forming cytoskeletal protein [Janthinobacterium tructae]